MKSFKGVLRGRQGLKERETTAVSSKPDCEPALSSFSHLPMLTDAFHHLNRLGRLVIDSWAICMIKLNSLHPSV
jgi:hypothetical protein